MREMLEGGPLDVLTGDYLGELTMSHLARGSDATSTRGYAETFVRQLEDDLGIAWERGVKIVANAGGTDPARCAAAIREVAGRLGLRINVAHVEGDDLLPRREALAAAGIDLPTATLTANTYLGGWGIAAALDAGAQVVVTGRITDVALVVGPAAWFHGWATDDYDALAGALIAGHVLEGGTQATGGNYSFFTEVPAMDRLGFPIAEISADGSAIITKHDGTGGIVDVGTVTAQLLDDLLATSYLDPDVCADLTGAELSQLATDRVRITGVTGDSPPETARVSINVAGGFRNAITFLLTGLDIDAKSALIQQQLTPSLAGIDTVDWTLSRTDTDDAARNDEAVARLTLAVKDADPELIGGALSSAVTSAALGSYPGAALAAPVGKATAYPVHHTLDLPNSLVEHRVVTDTGTPIDVGVNPGRAAAAASRSVRHRLADPPEDWGPIWRLPLGSIAGARSGEKSGQVSLGVWVTTDAAYHWLAHSLDIDCLGALLPEIRSLPVRRYELPNLRALTFVIDDLLPDGPAASTRQDPYARGLGEWLRSRNMDIPISLIEQ